MESCTDLNIENGIMYRPKYKNGIMYRPKYKNGIMYRFNYKIVKMHILKEVRPKPICNRVFKLDTNFFIYIVELS